MFQQTVVDAVTLYMYDKLLLQHAKKGVSDSLGLVDLAFGLVGFSLYLPDRQPFFEWVGVVGGGESTRNSNHTSTVRDEIIVIFSRTSVILAILWERWR